jgi:hypothetical protein
MAKRFTDTDKWKKKWYRGLTPANKLFWQYITDNCNHGGIWEVDFGLAAFQIGVQLDENEINAAFGERVTLLDNGEKWFIKGFVEFQYGELRQNNNAHRSVSQILSKYGLSPSNAGASQPLVSRRVGDKAKDQDKELVKEKDQDKESASHTPLHYCSKCKLNHSSALCPKSEDNKPGAFDDLGPIQRCRKHDIEHTGAFCPKCLEEA